MLRIALEDLEIEGASTHSLRRTALTTMHNSHVPLRIIQRVSGHRSLATLEEYLAVSDEQVKGAISSLSHLSYVNKIHYVGPGEAEEQNVPELEIEQ
ncbi:MAG: tyrosine-type recombinase/integrase [Cyanobacteria bacterium P01_G01_bin.4]